MNIQPLILNDLQGSSSIRHDFPSDFIIANKLANSYLMLSKDEDIFDDYLPNFTLKNPSKKFISPLSEISNSFCDGLMTSFIFPIVEENLAFCFRNSFKPYLLNLSYFFESTTPSLEITIPIDEVLDLSNNAKKILGSNSVARFNEFRLYKKGWDGRFSKSLSEESLVSLEKFLSLYTQFTTEPSLFLGFNGNLILGWDDEENNRIELEFSHNVIFYYIASIDIEDFIDVSDENINSLISKFTHKCTI